MSSSISCHSFFLMLSVEGFGFSCIGWNSGSTSTSPILKFTFFMADNSTLNEPSFSSSVGPIGNAILELRTLLLRKVSFTRFFRISFFPVTGTPNFLQAFFKLSFFLLSISSMKSSPMGDGGELGSAGAFGDCRFLPLAFFAGVGSYSLSSPSSPSTYDSSLSKASESQSSLVSFFFALGFFLDGIAIPLAILSIVCSKPSWTSLISSRSDLNASVVELQLSLYAPRMVPT
mmetsp:Transcript_15794/g.37953  ORF Transcript_15794/g.37953 Transcript_15794/m.37953 type:complete len:231 (-) Transcript_15794:3390-4082(-)